MKATRLAISMVSVIIFFAFAVGGFAQDDGVKTKKTPEEKAKKITDRMNTTLNLTSDQYSKIYNLNLNKIQKHQQSKESKKKDKAEWKKDKEEYRNSLKGILSDEQYSTLEQKRKEMKEKNGDKKGKKGNKNRNQDGDKQR